MYTLNTYNEKELKSLLLQIGLNYGYDLTNYISNDINIQNLKKLLYDGLDLETFIKVEGFQFNEKEFRNLKTLSKYNLKFPVLNHQLIKALLNMDEFNSICPLLVTQLKTINISKITSEGLAKFILEGLKRGESPDKINQFLDNHSYKFPNATFERYLLGFMNAVNIIELANFYMTHVTLENYKILYRYTFVCKQLIDNASSIAILNDLTLTARDRDLKILESIAPGLTDALEVFEENHLFYKDGKMIGYKQLNHLKEFKYSSTMSIDFYELDETGLNVEQLTMLLMIYHQIDPIIKLNRIYIRDYILLYHAYMNKLSCEELTDKQLLLLASKLKGVEINENLPIDLMQIDLLAKEMGIEIFFKNINISDELKPYILSSHLIGINIFHCFHFCIEDISDTRRIEECFFIERHNGDSVFFTDDSINIYEVKNYRRTLSQIQVS